MSALAPIRPQPMQTVSYQAWRLRDETAVPLELGEVNDVQDALAAACASCGHKDTLFLLCDDGRAKLLRAYVIQQGKREHRRDPVTGIPRWVHELKPATLFAMAVSAFDPVEPWRWTPGCDPVGLTAAQRNTVEA